MLRNEQDISRRIKSNAPQSFDLFHLERKRALGGGFIPIFLFPRTRLTLLGRSNQTNKNMGFPFIPIRLSGVAWKEQKSHLNHVKAADGMAARMYGKGRKTRGEMDPSCSTLGHHWANTFRCSPTWWAFVQGHF